VTWPACLGEEDDRTVVDLLIEQVEFANVIVINKADRATPEQLDLLEAMLRRLNPEAEILRARFGQVPLEKILDTGRFNMAQAAEAPGWLKELRGEHTPETEEYGISSFVFRARRPFHPHRFGKFLQRDWKGVLRAKGFFWFATRMDIAGQFSLAGGACRLEPAGYWLAPETADECPEETPNGEWDPRWGDRRQEIVFIGIGMEEAKLRRGLEKCLLTDAEMALGIDAWQQFTDPFDRWQVVDTEHTHA
jgi:G3E family GTPase